MPPRKEEENRPVIGTGSPAADRFLNEPFLPKIGRTLTAMFTPQAGSPPPMPAGVAAIPQNVSASRLNPVPFLQSLNPLANTPLIGGLAQGRGPRQEAPTPSVPVFPSGTPRIGFDIYPTAPQMPPTMPSQQPTQVASVSPRPATADDLDAFYRRGAYAPQPVAQVAQPTPQRTAIQTPYGTIYATQQQASNLAAAPSRTVDQQSTRSPAEQQALLAQMRDKGAEIGKNLAAEEAKRQQESIQRGYAFRQGLAESEAQRALTLSFGTEVSKEATMRGAQAMIEAERMRQAQQGRSPLSNEPISALGMQFQRGSMGQFRPVKNLSLGSSSSALSQSSFGGVFPSFDEWMQQNKSSFGDILRGGEVPSKGDFSDFALERSRKAVREKQKQDDWRRNQIDAGLPVVTLPVAQASGLPRYVGY